MRTIIIVVIAAGIFAAVAYWYVDNTNESVAPETNVTYETVGAGTPLGGGVLGGELTPDAVITRTADGYEPREVTIPQGGTVSFVNESESFHWPASDVHPTHNIYSEFDPLEPVAPGDTWSFTFTEAGTWAYHDHVRANLKGTIIVTPTE